MSEGGGAVGYQARDLTVWKYYLQSVLSGEIPFIVFHAVKCRKPGSKMQRANDCTTLGEL